MVRKWSNEGLSREGPCEQDLSVTGMMTEMTDGIAFDHPFNLIWQLISCGDLCKWQNLSKKSATRLKDD